MDNQTRLLIAKDDIHKTFESSDRVVFKRKDLATVLDENREFWRLTQAISLSDFIAFLMESGDLRMHRLKFPARAELRYTWGDVSDFVLIQSLRSNSYFSHFTALGYHGLTMQIPKTVYLNHEQAKKRATQADLSQDGIDRAFRNRCRASGNIAEFNDKRVCILNGKFTDQKGVINATDAFGRTFRVTDVERTLIDCVVRPVYAGGVQTVLEAFKSASEVVSVNRLAAMLRQLDFVYPYHQAIGFYLERSGVYSEDQIAVVERFDMEFDFYLVHQMKNSSYTKRWRIHYPSGF